MSSEAKSQARSHAIVIGASMAGLMAARALSDHFDRVTLLERDALPAEAAPRKGVPQGGHSHGLLAGGREAMEALFPGLTEELVAQGGLAGDLLADSIWFAHDIYLAPAPSGLQGVLISRPRLEAEIRRRVLALQNLRTLTGVSVTGLRYEHGRVGGVVFAGPEDATLAAADLVLDATGRGSRAGSWLQDLGFSAPALEEIEVGISYTTRIFERDPADLDGKLVALVGGYAPSWRFGVALAQEDNRWSVTLGGYFGDAAPLDDAGFAAFATSLSAPEIGGIVRRARPLSEPRPYRFASSQRRRYERLEQLPDGFVVLGDAYCSFNPVYGQGMTVAALQARALGACLAEGRGDLPGRFFAEAATIVETPWQIAVGSDFGHPQLAPRASRFQRFLNWYLVKLHHAAARDPSLSTAFLSVANLKAAPASLLTPRLAWRIARGNLSGALPARPALTHL